MAFLFGKKKKEEKLPELPELPELPGLPELPPLSKNLELPSPSASLAREKFKSELHPLPSFPPSETGEQVTREVVKQAIAEPYEQVSITPKKPLTKEIEEEYQILKPGIGTVIKPEKRIMERVVKEIKPGIKVEPVYVRIDKYQEALSDFQEIKRKLLEIDNLLREIKEIKAKEDSQLAEWEVEIQDAKAKLDRIDRAIFKKLEE